MYMLFEDVDALADQRILYTCIYIYIYRVIRATRVIRVIKED